MSIVLYPKNMKKLEELEKSLVLRKQITIDPEEIDGYIVSTKFIELRGYGARTEEEAIQRLNILPPYLIRVLKGLIILGGEAKTLQVAAKTGLSQGRSSGYLNDLYRLGFVEKYSKGRETCFRILAEYNLKDLITETVNNSLSSS